MSNVFIWECIIGSRFLWNYTWEKYLCIQFLLLTGKIVFIYDLILLSFLVAVIEALGNYSNDEKIPFHFWFKGVIISWCNFLVFLILKETEKKLNIHTSLFLKYMPKCIDWKECEKLISSYHFGCIMEESVLKDKSFDSHFFRHL